jgi:hypothetical protein
MNIAKTTILREEAGVRLKSYNKSNDLWMNRQKRSKVVFLKGKLT